MALTRLAEQTAGQPTVLPADRLLLLRWRLLAEGRLAEADRTRQAFLKFGRRHPWFDREHVLTLAETGSQEWRAWLEAAAPRRPGTLTPKQWSAVVQQFGRSTAWRTPPEGMALYARSLAALGQGPQALEVLRTLADAPYPVTWRRYAMTEVGLRSPSEAKPPGRAVLRATADATSGRLDGALDEPFWATAPAAVLHSADPNRPAGSVRVVRTATHVVMAVRLPATCETWRVELGVDADRDAWSQLQLACDTRGRKDVRLTLRYGAPATVPARHFQTAAQAGEREVTLELAFPLAMVGADPTRGAVWAVQVRAVGEGRGGPAVLTLTHEDVAMSEPERFGLLALPGPPPKAP